MSPMRSIPSIPACNLRVPTKRPAGLRVGGSLRVTLTRKVARALPRAPGPLLFVSPRFNRADNAALSRSRERGRAFIYSIDEDLEPVGWSHRLNGFATSWTRHPEMTGPLCV